MNNKEAVKALLEGKTLRIINKTKKHQTYRFNKEAIAIELIGHNLFFSIHDFVSDNEWEEVKEPYTDRGYSFTIQEGISNVHYLKIIVPAGRYKYQVKEIIE